MANTSTTAVQLDARRQLAVAMLAYAYLMAAYRESPSAGPLHTLFVQWYLANRGLYPDDSVLRSMEAARSQQLTSTTGYTVLSGYALGIALAAMAPAFLTVWRRSAIPAQQAALGDWMESSGFFTAAGTAPALDLLDARLRVTLDPVRAAPMANQLMGSFINTGTLPQREQPVPGSTPGEIRAMEYEGVPLPEGPKGSSDAPSAASSTPDTSTSMTTSQASLPSPFRSTDTARLALGIGGLILAGTGLYYFIQSQAKR